MAISLRLSCLGYKVEIILSNQHLRCLMGSSVSAIFLIEPSMTSLISYSLCSIDLTCLS